MTGDVKIELTITAEAVERFFSLLGFLKERTEETREKRTEEIPPITPKEDNKKENKEEKKESNISSCSYVDDDVVIANKPSNKHVVNNSSNNDVDVVYPPTKKEIEEYANSKGYKLDVNRFYLYYSRLGWCNKGGTSIIRTWRDTLDYWMTNGLSTSSAMQPVDKNNREALKATHPFVPTDF